MAEKQISLYDVVNEKFSLAQRTTYLHRIIYIGEHNFSESNSVKQFFQTIISTVNSQDPDEILTGFLLYYQKIFVHLLEGSEATILRHLRRMYSKINAGETHLETMKVLIVCHHINQRVFKNWSGRTARPPILLEAIDPMSDVETTWRHVKTCISKLYKLIQLLQSQTLSINITMEHFSEIAHMYLPETQLLNFLLGSKFILDLQEYFDMYYIVAAVKSYEEIIWPIEEDLVPYNLLEPEEHKFLCDMDVLKKPLIESESES